MNESARSLLCPSNNPSLPKVFLDITVEHKPFGRIVIELRSDIVPRTAENFRVLCTGERGYGYKGTMIYRIIPNFMCEGGDFEFNNGLGGHSIYGGYFEDENYDLNHELPGTVSMMSEGLNENGSRFFISTKKLRWLDGKHVVFGRVVEGFDIVKKIDVFGSQTGQTILDVRIGDCGQL